ncbi:MAG: hypothetical protein GOVbin225_51 [Prokaryotic dsDNA virus sp.]|mgnify:CR=1 FL=1|nr:MAG: hypothetical protein GOVbin225_51 [Prokaryotic dsDNA virus sp.]|tara:strand:- start:1450 stop:1896 length:447 start_codon:yes stop_codon:yes gene_type:complete
MIIKKLTEELITEKLEKTGIGEWYNGTEVQVNNIKLHFDFKLTDDYNSPDFAIYSQTTADGYELWVAIVPPYDRYNIEEDVHYYDSDLGERLEQFIRECDKDDIHIYIDDLDYDWIDEAMAGLWDDVYEKLREDMEYALELEGYEYED